MARRSLFIGRMAAALALAVALLVLTGLPMAGADGDENPCAGLDVKTGTMNLPNGGGTDLNHVAFCIPAGTEGATGCADHLKDEYGLEPVEGTDNQFEYTGEEELDPEAVLAEPGGERGQLVMSSSGLDVRINGAPSITEDGIRAWLADKNPALLEADPDLPLTFYETSIEYNIDPAIALSFFQMESSYGKAGRATSTLSIGNIREYGDGPAIDGFRAYDTWSDGVEDYYQLLAGNVYVASGLTTVEQIVPKYAPAADNNVPTQYIESVRSTAEAIQQYEEVMGPDGGTSTGSGGGARGCYPRRPTPRRLPDCPKMENFDNVVDYLTEIEAMFDDMLEFYEPLVDELKASRSALFAEQAKCHGAIDDFASRYGVPCEMEAFETSDEGEEEEGEPEAEEDAGGGDAEPEEEDPYEATTGIEGDLHPEEEVTLSVFEPEVKDAHPLEALVIGDDFGPALCAGAVKDNCLADDAWQCRKGTDHIPEVVGTCGMCVAEGCWAGTGCGTCGEEDDDDEGDKKLTPVHTDGSSGTYPPSEGDALTGGTDPFGVKDCKGQGLAEGERTYVVIERGVHANVEALELQQCQQAAIDVKDRCILDGAGGFLGDGGDHGPTEVLVSLDDLIRNIESFVFDLGKLTDEVHKMAEETKKDLDGKDAITWPTAGRQTSPYGQRDALCADANLCKPHFHHGLDISQAGTVPVVAAADGKVSGLVKESSGSCYGNAVFLDHGNNLQTRYGHLRSLEVSMSQVVDQGQRIGLQGNTGCSTGQHLHFEIRVNGKAVDPLEVLQGKSNVFLLFHEAEIFSTMSKNAENIKPTQEALKAFVTFLREYTKDVCGAGGMSEGDVPSFLVGASEGWANGESCKVTFPPLFEGDDCTSTQDADTEEDPPEEEEEPGTKPEESGEHLEDCPSEKHRGGCIATTTTTSVSDSNSDAWGESIDILLSLAGWYPEELFLDDEKCFGYNTEGGSPGVSGSASPGGTPGPGGESFGTEDGAEDDVLPGQDAEEGDDDPLVQCCRRLFNTETVVGTGGAIAYTARSWLGVAYALGGSDRDGVDGPGLVLGVMLENGFELPRTAMSQMGSCEELGGMRVAWNVLRPGDLVFLKGEGSTDVSHAGVYVGDDLIVNAPGPEGVVRLDKLSLLRRRWSGGCRIGSSASSDTVAVSWCQEEVDELCCRGPGLELELAISEEACGMSCDELCNRKHTRHTVAHTLCRHACGARDEQCDSRTDESACEVEGVDGLCCEEKCMVHALMCASRVEVCMDIRDGEQCSFGGDDGVCCGGRCLTGGGACTPCAVGPAMAKDPATGECERFESVCDVPTGRTECGPCPEVDAFAKDPMTGECERFDSPCNVPYGWSECEGHGCASLDDGDVCSIDGALGICCGGGCAVAATSCKDDPAACAGQGESETCATDPEGICCSERCAVGAVTCGECPRTVTHAYDPSTGRCVRYDTSCDVPKGWPPCIASTCLTECQNAHPSNPAPAQACRERCESADISCEERCLTASDDTDERSRCIGQCSDDVTSTMPETLRYCETGCLMDDDDAQTALCMSMCRATHPHVNIELAIVRSEQEPTSLFTGERPRLRIIVENRGSRDFAGSIETVLRELSDCTCPACPVGYMCPCDCKVGERPVVRFDDVLLSVGKKTTYLSDPFLLPATLAGTTLQPVAILRDAGGRAVGAPRGPFYGVAAPGPVSVDDAGFTIDGGEQTTTAAPGSTATASLVLTTARAPTIVTVSIVTATGVLIEGTERTHELSFPVQGRTLPTGPLTVTGAQAGSLFRIGYRIGSGDTVLAEGVLDEQGRPPGLCDDRELATGCEQLHLQAPRSYPHAFLEVRQPQLVTTDASFMDSDGHEAILLPAGTPVRAMVELANPSGRPFMGTVTVSVTQEDGSTVPGSEQTIEVGRGLDGSSSRSFETATFQTSPGRSYRIRALGKDLEGAVWLDEVVPTVLFPMAGLNVPESAVSGITRNDVFTSVAHEGCRARVACVQCLSTCELRVEGGRCTVTPFNCDCDCTMEAIS